MAAPPVELKQRIDALEESYEYCLAYAAQGMTDDTAPQSGGRVRGYLERSDAALSGLADLFLVAVDELGLERRDPYRAFVRVLERDAADAQAAIQLVLAQDRISSQLVDNLNASIHLRALLTDIFLIDEILDTHVARARKS